MKRRISRWAGLVVSIGTVLLSIAGAELVLRMFFPGDTDHESIAVHVMQDLPGLRPEILYERDAFGLRRLTLNPEVKVPGTVRILCLGASTTDQPTQDTVNTWCGLLELKLNERFGAQGIHMETATLAHGGWRVADLIAHVDGRIDMLKPDIAIILMGINDLAFNGGLGYSYTGLSDRLAEIKRVQSAPKGGFWGQCEAASLLCKRVNLLRKKLRELSMRRAGQILEWHSQNLPTLRNQYQVYPYIYAPKREPDPLQEFEEGMHYLLGLLERHGVDAIVLGQPVLWSENMSEGETKALWFYIETPEGRVRPSGGWLLQEMRRFNTVQMKVAQKHGDRYVDLDPLIPKDLEHYFDDCHFTDLGSREVSSQILFPVASVVQARLEHVALRQTFSAETFLPSKN